MSIDAAVARVQQILLAEQQLLAPPSTAVQGAAATGVEGPAASPASGGQSFAATLAGAQASSGAPAPTGGAAVAPFVAHGGQYGFFPDPGKDYSHGKEPEIAARLDALGRALHLHLVGLSGYRTPAHSIAVGGFADDPHTRGEASDTPGIEAVPESTLRQFGLTRPFSGAAEADHIQLA